MIADIWTVMWKEWKEMLLSGGGRGGRLGLLVFVAVFGIYLPLQMGRDWVESPVALFYWMWVPLFLVTSVIADSFAGERERHILETLLASRLSDRAILFGKVGAAVGYGWGLTMISLLLGLVTVNLAHGRGELLLYPPEIGLAIVVFTLLGAVLVAAVGVFVSLRAPTVRQAQQILSLSIMLLLFVPTFGIQALPVEWRLRLAEMLAAVDVAKIALIGGTVMTVLDIGLLAAAMARFQRARLILD
ncbi:MAG: ABC transporter permease [Chloroflexi bacterium]|nr:ABC transporter permease [Chloroflexota bacterium]